MPLKSAAAALVAALLVALGAPGAAAKAAPSDAMVQPMCMACWGYGAK